MCPLPLLGFCKVCTVYSICHLSLQNQTTFSHVDLNFRKNANCFVKLKWISKQWSFVIFFFFWWFITWWKNDPVFFTMWSVLLTEVSHNGLYDVFCEIFKARFGDNLEVFWWVYLAIRGCSWGPKGLCLINIPRPSNISFHHEILKSELLKSY